MAFVRLKTWTKEYLTYQDLNAEVDNIYVGLNQCQLAADMVSTNTPNKGVKRDSAGNFAANEITAVKFIGPLHGNVTGNLTGNVTGNVTGNADTATNGCPAGAVMAFARSTPPTGWLECNGTAVSRTTYAALFAAIGTTFGAGDGSTTFNLPDLRGEFIRGWDHGRGVDSGRTLGSWQADELKAHTHNGTTYELSYTPNHYNEVGHGTGNTRGTYTTNSTGGSETRPRNVALMYCIKY